MTETQNNAAKMTDSDLSVGEVSHGRRFEVIGWDVRDKTADEQSSTLGESDSMTDAIQRLSDYIASPNGLFIYRVEIVDHARK